MEHQKSSYTCVRIIDDSMDNEFPSAALASFVLNASLPFPSCLNAYHLTPLLIFLVLYQLAVFCTLNSRYTAQKPPHQCLADEDAFVFCCFFVCTTVNLSPENCLAKCEQGSLKANRKF